MNIDVYFLNKADQFAGRWIPLDSVAIFLAEYMGYQLLLILLAFIAINPKKYWKMVAGALASGFVARMLIVQPIRWIMPRPRPFVAAPVTQLVMRSPTASFPSGHAAFFFTLSFFVLFWMKKMDPPPKHCFLISAFFIISSTLIGSARIFCGIHWFSDIIGGLLVGYCCGLLGSIWTRKLPL